MILSNLHTHSIFCDGTNSIEEMIQMAISMEFESIGFSGHAYTPFDQSYCMSEKDTVTYFNLLSSLKEKYKNKIKIYIGLEYDKYSKAPVDSLDFLIYSVHYIKKGNEYLPVDLSLEYTKKIINEYFSGNAYEYVSSYYNEYQGYKKIHPNTILGHFDLITRFNKNNTLFDENSPKYRNIALNCLHNIIKEQKLFEANTATILKGIRTSPYPDTFILKELCALGGEIILSSDCHCRNNLTVGFAETAGLLSRSGFKNRLILRDNGFVNVSL